MAMEEKRLQRFGEVVRHVYRGIDAIEEDKVTLYPFAQREVFDIYVTCLWGGFWGIAHGGTSIVVFIEEGCCFLGNVEIPENAPDKKYHFTHVIGSHTCHCWLKFAFICDGAPGESNANTAEGLLCIGASCPIRVRISMGDVSIKLRSVLQKDVLFVAVNRGSGPRFVKFWAGCPVCCC